MTQRPLPVARDQEHQESKRTAELKPKATTVASRADARKVAAALSKSSWNLAGPMDLGVERCLVPGAQSSSKDGMSGRVFRYPTDTKSEGGKGHGPSSGESVWFLPG